MASGKMLSLKHGLFSLNTSSMNWRIPQRNISKKNMILKKMGLPELPKRPPSGYFNYCKAVRPQLVAQNPDMSPTDVIRALAKRWQREPENEKQKYNKDAQAKLEIYKNEMYKFNKSLSEEAKQEMKDLLVEEEVKKNQESLLKKLREQEKTLKRPKRPPTMFAVFLKNTEAFKKRELKEASQVWKEMSQKEKEKYKAEFDKEMKKYNDDMLKWEDEMLQQGNIDLVKLQSIREKLLSFA